MSITPDLAERELRQLSEQMKDKEVKNVLLYCDKSGHLGIEKKTFFGRIIRFFTVTIFRSHAYDFEHNIDQIQKLFSSLPQDSDKYDDLKTKIDSLVTYVCTQKKITPKWNFHSLHSPGAVPETGPSMRAPATKTTSVSDSQFDQFLNAFTQSKTFKNIDDVRKLHRFGYLHNRLEDVAKALEAAKIKKADEPEFEKIKNEIDNDVKQLQSVAIEKKKVLEALKNPPTDADEIIDLAERAAAVFLLDNAFDLYKSALSRPDFKFTNDTAVSVNQFIELGLTLKKFDEVKQVTQDLQASRGKPVGTLQNLKNTVDARIKRIQAFADPAIRDGFSKNELLMLQEFARTYDETSADEIKGPDLLKPRSVEFRDFMIYACGNADFNRRLKKEKDLFDAGKSSYPDEKLQAAFEYFATFSFKSDLKNWQTNQLLCEHLSKLTLAYELQETIKTEKQRLARLESLSSIMTEDQIKIKPDNPILAGRPERKIIKEIWIPPKRKGFSRSKGRFVKKIEVIPGIPPKTVAEYKREVIEQANKARIQGIKDTKERIEINEAKLKIVNEQLVELQSIMSKNYKGKNPKKLQPEALSQLDSTYRFTDTLTEGMNSSLDLCQNPVFAAMYNSIESSAKAYKWIQERSSETGGYRTGDMSVLNELKREKVTGRKQKDFVDRAALELFPFGHMAIINQEHGITAFSHQRFSFDHADMSLTDYVTYDTYRLDFSKMLNTKTKAVLKALLEDEGMEVESEASARGLSQDEFLAQELEERYETIFAEILEMGKLERARKLNSGEKPDFMKLQTYSAFTKWLEAVNAKRPDNDKLEPSDVLEITPDMDEDIHSIVENLTIEYMKELYNKISNDSSTQQRAFMKSWKYAGPLGFIRKFTDKTLDINKMKIEGDMCCSQFSLLLTIRALKELEASLQEKSPSQTPYLSILRFIDEQYKASTTEFVLKQLQNQLRPVRPPRIIQELVDLEDKDFQPIAIQSTIGYMADRFAQRTAKAFSSRA